MLSKLARGKCDKIDLVKLDSMECFVHSIHRFNVLSFILVFFSLKKERQSTS